LAKSSFEVVKLVLKFSDGNSSGRCESSSVKSMLAVSLVEFSIALQFLNRPKYREALFRLPLSSLLSSAFALK